MTFLISLGVSAIVAWFFRKPIDAILRRIIADEISTAWLKYLQFAIYVVGISSGVRIWELERYITPQSGREQPALALTTQRWVLEVYRTIIEALQGIAVVLLVFFVIALIAFVLVRIFELRKEKPGTAS